MEHSASLITTLAAGFGLALILGFVAAKLKLPALVGYLVAGICIGPATPGFVADAQIASQLAEVGVMLLMFGVGLHFSIDDLMAVRKIALPGAVVQIAAATAMGAGVASFWGWSLGASLVFGISLSVASTVVLLKALESEGLTDATDGRIAIGWLVVEDLAMVLVLVLLPALAPSLGGSASQSSHSTTMTIVITLAQVGGFVAFMLVVGRRLFPVDLVAGHQDGLARAVHAVRWWPLRSALPMARRPCLACRLRWGLFCGHGVARIRVQRPRRRADAAAARRLCRAVFCVGGHAV